MMRNSHFPWLWEAKIKEGTKSHLRSLLESVFKLFDLLVRCPIFPPDWFVMKMVTNQTILNVMTEIAKPLVSYFLNDGPFDNQVVRYSVLICHIPLYWMCSRIILNFLLTIHFFCFLQMIFRIKIYFLLNHSHFRIDLYKTLWLVKIYRIKKYC